MFTYFEEKVFCWNTYIYIDIYIIYIYIIYTDYIYIYIIYIYIYIGGWEEGGGGERVRDTRGS